MSCCTRYNSCVCESSCACAQRWTYKVSGARSKGAPLLSGVKYILRTELIFERVDSPLTPRKISPEEELAWTRIVSLYELSEVSPSLILPFASRAPASHHLVHLQSLYRDRDSTGFVEAYLEALELQRSFTASASAGQATLPFPVRLPSRPFSRYRSASDQCA